MSPNKVRMSPNELHLDLSKIAHVGTLEFAKRETPKRPTRNGPKRRSKCAHNVRSFCDELKPDV